MELCDKESIEINLPPQDIIVERENIKIEDKLCSISRMYDDVLAHSFNLYKTNLEQAYNDILEQFTSNKFRKECANKCFKLHLESLIS